jgi:hypothetical protein
MISLNDRQERVYLAFREKDPEYKYRVVEMTNEYLIIASFDEPSGLYQKVPYTYDDTTNMPTISDDEMWVPCEKEYIPATTQIESFKSSRKVKESTDVTVERRGRNFHAIGITADVTNRNNRVYPKNVLREAVNTLKTNLSLSNGQGRFLEELNLLGEVEHPESKTGQPNLNEVAIRWVDVEFDEETNQVKLEGTILPTPSGNILLTLLENGVNIGISQRAMGRALTRPDGVEVIKELAIKGYDAVYMPSDPNGRITELLESFDESKKLIALSEKYKDIIGDSEFGDESELREALNLGSGDLETELETVRTNRLETAQKEFDAQVMKLFVEASIEQPVAHSFKSLDEVKIFIDAALVEAEKAEAKKRIENMGGNKTMDNISSVVPIVEKELGVPAYAKAFVESQNKFIAQSGKSYYKTFPTKANARTGGEKIAAKLLENYFKKYEFQLTKESELLEAVNGMVVSDLSLPYTVNAQIIAEMFPRLVAAELFTFVPMANREQRVYVEAFSGNTAGELDVTVAATALNAFSPSLHPTPAIGSWMTLAQKNITPGSVAFSGGMVEGTDYVVDYRNGKIKSLTSGFAGLANTVTLTYKYRTTMNGELGAVSRVKQILTPKTLVADPRRLAATVSDEAYRYGQSDLGYDAQAAAIRGATDALAREFDQQILYRALTELLQVTSNTVTYSRANAVDAVSTGFNVRVGEAKAKIEKRNYDSNICKLLVDVDQAELMSNSGLFESARSRPDFAWGAGAVGLWKNLPVYSSNQFAGGSTSWSLVVHPDLLQVGIYVPIEVDPAVPTYADDASGKLIDAKSFLVRTYDAIECVVQDKGSVVKITA